MTIVVQFQSRTPATALSSRKGGAAADPYELTRMLMDGALERIEAARGDLENGKPSQQHRLLQSAIMIIDGLRADLDLREGGAIAANVDNLYDYMCRRLRAADPRNGVSALNEVSHLLEALRSAWMFMPAQVRAASRS